MLEAHRNGALDKWSILVFATVAKDEHSWDDSTTHDLAK
jgi:hypothetical protein